MPDSVADLAKKWLDLPPPGRLAKAWIATKALYHRGVKPKVWGPLHFTTQTATASFGPIITYLTGALGALAAGTLFLLLFGLNGIATFFRWKATSRPVNSRRAVTDMMVRVGDLLSCINIKQVQSDKDAAVPAALGLLEILAREITGLEKDAIAVSVALYEGSSTEKMVLKYRNPGNTRPVRRPFHGESALGHWVCRAGPTPRIVHDLRKFGSVCMKSPTQSSVNYRSILFLPLFVDRKGNSVLRGFLSVDATVPYAFHGSRGIDLIVYAEPIVQQIQALI